MFENVFTHTFDSNNQKKYKLLHVCTKYNFDRNNNIITVFFPALQYELPNGESTIYFATPVGWVFGDNYPIEYSDEGIKRLYNEAQSRINYFESGDSGDGILTDSSMTKSQWVINVDSLKVLIEY